MPELPEVQTVVDSLRPHLIGRRVTRLTLHRADIIEPAGFDLAGHVVGRTLGDVTRRGKRIILCLDDGHRLYVHLGMTGRLLVTPTDAPLAPHTHLTFAVDAAGGTEVRFIDPRRFGGVFWLGLDSPDGTMGPEPFDMTPARLARRLAATSRVVKAVLLDQTVIAGIGNIYADEALFLAGLHPLRRGDDLSAEEVARLNRSIKRVLRAAIRHRGSTLRDYVDAAGKGGGFQKQHRVYDRAGQPCKTCQTPIVRIVTGGRSTHFCPACQPEVAANAVARRRRELSRGVGRGVASS